MPSEFYEQLGKSGKEIIGRFNLNYGLFEASNPNDNLKLMENGTQKNIEVNFSGDIVLQGVQDPDSFAKDLKFCLSSAVTRELSKHM